MASLQGALSRWIQVNRPLSIDWVANKFNLSRPLSIRSLIDSLPTPWISGGETKHLAVHASLFSPGFILFFGGTEYDHDNLAHFTIKNATIYDCETYEQQEIVPPETDTFCCGHSLDAEGRLVVAGGTKPYTWDVPHDGHGDHWLGIRNTSIFDPVTRSWSNAAMMNLEPRIQNPRPDSGGRWYPTLLTLADGQILAMSGHPDVGDSRHVNNSPEIFFPDQNIWRVYNDLGDREFQVQYPRLHVLPNGEIFCATSLLFIR